MTAATAEAPIKITDTGGIRIVALDRPAKANALTPKMLTELRRSVETLAPRCIGVVICGAEGMFSGGIDLDSRHQDAGAPSVQELLSQLVEAIQACPVPVAALIDGPCVGGSLEMAVSCDLRIGTARARFHVPATSIGVVYRPDGYRLLLQRLGTTTVRRLLLLGLQFDASAGLASGLLDIIDDDPGSRASEMFDELRKSPGTFAAQKRALWATARSLAPDAEDLAEVARIRSAHDQRAQEQR